MAITRNGLLAANLLSLHLQVPFTHLEGLFQGNTFGSGGRLLEDHAWRGGAILVVDDSVRTGEQMSEARDELQDRGFASRSIFCAPYVTVEGGDYVDYWHEIVPTPRVWGWNIMHHPIVKSSCIDLDGVLCRDPTPEENDDGERYERFIATVEPRYVPNYEVGWIVTARLEKYRARTRAWLREHGIEYGELIMMDVENAEERRRLNNHGAYKASFYESTNAQLFIESEPGQAAEIAERTDRSVFCVSDWEMVTPSFLPGPMAMSRRQLRHWTNLARTSPMKAARLVGRRGLSSVRKAFKRVRRLLG